MFVSYLVFFFPSSLLGVRVFGAAAAAVFFLLDCTAFDARKGFGI